MQTCSHFTPGLLTFCGWLEPHTLSLFFQSKDKENNIVLAASMMAWNYFCINYELDT